MKITEKTKNALKFLSENFTQKDYEDYLTGNTSYNNLCKKFDCSDYLMSTFFKSMGYEKRRSRIKNTIKEDIFDNIDSSEKAYIFGFYMADGCITSQNYFKISISNNDIDILTKMRDYIAPSCKIHIKSEYINHKTGIKTNPMCEFVFKNNHIAETLNSYNCGHNKTYIDKSIKNIVPEEFMWDFIRGYFDGDGCVSSSIVTKKHILTLGEIKEYKHENVLFKITSKTPIIVNEIKEFLDKYNIKVFIQTPRNTFEVATTSKKELIKLYKYLYKNPSMFMQRKFEKFKHIIDNTEVISETKESETP